MAIEKIKILGAVLELPAKQHCQFSQFTVKMGQMGWIGSAVKLVAPKRPPGFLTLGASLLSSTANSANPPRKWAKWAKLAMLFSW